MEIIHNTQYIHDDGCKFEMVNEDGKYVFYKRHYQNHTLINKWQFNLYHSLLMDISVYDMAVNKHKGHIIFTEIDPYRQGNVIVFDNKQDADDFMEYFIEPHLTAMRLMNIKIQ